LRVVANGAWIRSDFILLERILLHLVRKGERLLYWRRTRLGRGSSFVCSCQYRKSMTSFDHLVGAAEHREWDGEAERLWRT
jgi:hypothetical protein